MIEKHFEELRAVVEKTDGLPEVTRSELLRIADKLEREALELGQSDEPASGTSDDNEASDEPSGVSGLVSAIEGLEASHPELTAAVNNTAAMLSRLGF